VFLSAPNAIIGWDVKLPAMLVTAMASKGGFRPSFLHKAIERTPQAVTLDRRTGLEVDLRQCVERNLLGQPSLIDRNVVLIGCGTIGGYLARLLAQSGAGCGGSLNLYDIDNLSPGNIGRHALGVMKLGQNKAQATADWLRSDFHPDIDVAGFPTDATRAWGGIARADLIIDATGEQNVSTALNELYCNMETSDGTPTLLHTWVFGNGVAAQSFLNMRDDGACYRCLKTDFAGQWRVNPLRDVTAEQVHAPARCGEAGYVPFSVDAPSAAACLALRAALDWAGSSPGKKLRTTVIDQKAGRERVRWTSPSKLVDCPACGSH
jgi:molybdopterin/thiamine biosynthesis adenylyltransferase